ncbi:MAG TPA: bacillithiol biosynthesis BshC, partial [Polyangia bacterium]|nr:bacillithiol biosynthesis BshC [Polyangia bacterium]
RLRDAGFDEQIAPRPDCSLLFFHPHGAAGPRFRLRRAPDDGERWTLAGDATTIAHPRLLEIARAEPSRFSTSALLRPIVQDTLLPTVAYVGGPGEINYFAELPPLYVELGAHIPLVVPRGRFRCLDARARRLLRELGLSPDDASRPLAELSDRLPARGPPGAPDPAALRRRVDETLAPALEAILAAALAGDPSLARAADRTRATVTRAVGRFAGRYERAWLARDTVTSDRFERLRAALCPDGVPQERAYAWPSLAGRLGWRVLKRMVLDSLERDGAFQTALRDIEP